MANITDTKLIQQGDVLFFRTTGMPEGLKPVEKDPSGRIVFALGEATGHHHSAVMELTEEGTDNIRVFEDSNGTMWLEVVEKPVAVTHQEHGTVTLDPGIYRKGLVREYDPLADECRAVAD